jgi:hypothetical protein
LTVFRADKLLAHEKSVVRFGKNATVISGETPTHRGLGSLTLARDVRAGLPWL